MDIIFSIVIPIFNSEKFLSVTIKSVINQKNDKTEIILINDNSSDKSKKICQSFKKRFNFIKLINNKKNYGVGYCRNQAIKNARGKYIVFLDQDFDHNFELARKKIIEQIEKLNWKNGHYRKDIAYRVINNS